MALENLYTNLKQKKDFLLFEKSHHFTIYINQAIINMKEGIKEKGKVIPKRICKLLIEQIKDTNGKSKSYEDIQDIPLMITI